VVIGSGWSVSSVSFSPSCSSCSSSCCSMFSSVGGIGAESEGAELASKIKKFDILYF
jgi:hypothetical protein